MDWRLVHKKLSTQANGELQSIWFERTYLDGIYMDILKIVYLKIDEG